MAVVIIVEVVILIHLILGVLDDVLNLYQVVAELDEVVGDLCVVVL